LNTNATFVLIWQNVAVPVDAATAGMVNALIAWVGTPFKLAVVAYLIIILMIAAWSSDETAFQKFFRQLWLAAIIYTLASNADAFNYYVTGVVHWVVNSIGVAIGNVFNHAVPISGDGFDAIGSRAFSVGLAVFKNLPWYSWKTIPLGLLVVAYWFLAFVAIVIMFSVYLVSYVATDFLIGIGPIFMALFFFPFTRQWFDGWLRNLMAGVLVQIFTVSLGAMFVAVIGVVLGQAATGLAGSQLGQVNGGVVIGEMMTLVVTALACLIFAILSGVLVIVAANIAGGIHAELGIIRAPTWPGSGRDAAPAAPATNPGNPSASSGTGTPSGPTGSGAPSREYAFNRSVGSAP
jgi:hypothetical protein